MMRIPSVDIIVPCYRYAHFLTQCVESALSQRSCAIRVLIIDDASPDNTRDIAGALCRRDRRVAFRRHAVNRGHIATYNEGLEWASADYLLLLSADDYLLPGALERAATLMNAHPDVGFTYGHVVELREGQTNTGEVAIGSRKGNSRVRPGIAFIESSKGRNLVATPTAVVRTSVHKRVGFYNPKLPHSGDLEMWLRLAAHAAVGELNDSQAVYRRHRDNMSLAYYANNQLLDLEHRRAAFESFFVTCSDRLDNPERLRKRALRSLACEAIGLASSAFNRGEHEGLRQLCDFARRLCPTAVWSLPWAKLACKQGLGPSAWGAVQLMRSRMSVSLSRDPTR